MSRVPRGFALLALSLAALACLAVPPAARADAVYTYTGNPFTTFFGGDACPGICGLSLSFVVPAPLISMPFGAFTPESFTISDGNTTINNTNDDPAHPLFELATGPDGIPTEWGIQVYTSNDSTTLFTAGNTISGTADLSETCSPAFFVPGQSPCRTLLAVGEIGEDPGIWSVTTSSSNVPEPSSLFLLAFGLAALAFLHKIARGAEPLIGRTIALVSARQSF